MIKRFSKCLLIVLSLLIAFITPKVYAEDEVYIEEITLIDHSTYATEKSAPTKNGLSIGFDLSFSQVDDFAKYRIVVNNPTDTNYELNKNIDFQNSDYLEYKVNFENDNNIINAGQKLNIFITITYKNVVPVTMLTDGKLIENNSLSLNLSNETGDTVVNPSTMDRVLLYVLTLIITSGFSITFYIITKNKRYLSIFVLGLLLIPFEAYALEKLEFKIETKVIIEEKFFVNYVYGTTIKSSEKDNYVLEDNDACYSTQNSEYEFCYIVYTDPVLHAKGEEVTLLESIETSYINEQGELSSEMIYTDGNDRPIIASIRYSSNEIVYMEDSIGTLWHYTFSDNPGIPDDPYLDIFNQENIYEHYVNTGEEVYEYVRVKTPSTFKMQNHDMKFLLYYLTR